MISINCCVCLEKYLAL
uniref:Uncharacterized protein n=1 Tax=Anguilla anguilla TaxID=7936 RepID=A0A0E9PPR9_ANGAN